MFREKTVFTNTIDRLGAEIAAIVNATFAEPMEANRDVLYVGSDIVRFIRERVEAHPYNMERMITGDFWEALAEEQSFGGYAGELVIETIRQVLPTAFRLIAVEKQEAALLLTEGVERIIARAAEPKPPAPTKHFKHRIQWAEMQAAGAA